MHSRRCRAVVSAALVIVFVAVPAAAGQLPPPASGWTVAYDHLDSLFERGLTGTLQVEGGFLRFRAINRQLAWDIPLEDVYSIKTEETVSPIKVRVKSIVIESREGNTDVRRRIAPLDGQLQFVPPVVLAGLMKEKLKQFGERRALTARQQ
jgi:hypothetical protein